MDSDLQAEGIDPAELADPAAGGTTFEVDYSASELGEEPSPSAEPAGEAHQAPPVPASEPDPVSALEQRLAAREREIQEMRGYLQPMLEHFRQQNLPQKSPITFEQLASDPNLGPDAWAQTFRSYIDQNLANVQGQIQQTARAAASQQRARGLLSRESMGEGRDFDSIINRHVAPAYAEAPWLRDALYTRTEDPAMAEYAFGRILEMVDRAKGDPVKAFRDLDSALGARAAGAKEALTRVTTAAQGAARKVLGASEAGPQPVTKRVKDAWELPDKDFDAYVEQTGGL